MATKVAATLAVGTTGEGSEDTEMREMDPLPPSTTVAAEAGDLTTGAGRHLRTAVASASIEGTMTGSLPSTMTAASTSEEA
jgi:hypothetical protein